MFLEHSLIWIMSFNKPYLFKIKTTDKFECIINNIICVGIVEYHRNYRSVGGKYLDDGYESYT